MKRVIFFLLGTLALAMALLFLSFFFMTEENRRLHRENRMYEQLYPGLKEREQLVNDAVAGLQLRDGDIYWSIFGSEAPNVDPASSFSFLFASDSIPETRLEKYTTDKSAELLAKCAEVEKRIGDIFLRAADTSFVAPPMLLPLKDLTYPQVGAGIGRRVSPLYKISITHTGLDLIVPQGTPVYAPADGIVENPNSTKSMGKVVRIRHDGGYATVYKHLETSTVKVGQRVKRGARIGTVGMTGQAVSPHLHYEVVKDSTFVNPMNYIFSSVTPEEYANMLYMSVKTKQSMD